MLTVYFTMINMYILSFLSSVQLDCYILHFIIKETETQRGQIGCSRIHKWNWFWSQSNFIIYVPTHCFASLYPCAKHRTRPSPFLIGKTNRPIGNNNCVMHCILLAINQKTRLSLGNRVSRETKYEQVKFILELNETRGLDCGRRLYKWENTRRWRLEGENESDPFGSSNKTI